MLVGALADAGADRSAISSALTSFAIGATIEWDRVQRRGMAATVVIKGEERQIEGVGNGPIAALVDARQRECDIELTVVDYREHAIGAGADAQATAYVQVRDPGVVLPLHNFRLAAAHIADLALRRQFDLL